MMSSSKSQPTLIVPGSTSGCTDTEQTTSCLCPTVYWPKPLEMFGEESTLTVCNYYSNGIKIHS